MQPTSKKTVMRMREAYENTTRKISTESLKNRFTDRPWIQEATSTWVSRKDIETLLNDNNADGLRIYYGCHDESTDSDKKLDYLGMHNLIFVATKDSVSALNPTTETSVDQLRDITISENGQLTTYEGSAGEFTGLCPPSCPPPPPGE